jgi:hypothetical protein
VTCEWNPKKNSACYLSFLQVPSSSVEGGSLSNVESVSATTTPFSLTKHHGSVLPMRGIASEVEGIFSATIFRKTVRDRRIVTPVARRNHNEFSVRRNGGF